MCWQYIVCNAFRFWNAWDQGQNLGPMQWHLAPVNVRIFLDMTRKKRVGKGLTSPNLQRCTRRLRGIAVFLPAKPVSLLLIYEQLNDIDFLLYF